MVSIRTRQLDVLLITLQIAAFLHGITYAAPPLFDPIGGERWLNSNVYVVEGDLAEFTVSAEDPDGDDLTFSAEDVPAWATFDPGTRTFSGVAPLWSNDFGTRGNQQGIFDVLLKVTDGAYTATKIITINVLDSRWTPQTVAGLVANRPITQGAIGSTVSLDNVVDETVWTDYGGGKWIRRITFDFIGQVPNVPGWESDWATVSVAYLPVDTPAIYDAGAVVYMNPEWGQSACAELGVPVLVLMGYKGGGEPGQTMFKYLDKAVETRDPTYLWFVFSSAYFLRQADALFTVVDSMTSWPVSYSGFKTVVSGLSKFGYTSWTTAAASSQRVAGL
ncbi:MAG: putative Ig domain-containing protein, partial [Phycisphaerales bacterium]